MTSPFHDSMSLGEARGILRGLVGHGSRCPCCSRFAKVYRRKLNSGMALALLRFWRHAGTLQWAYKPDVLRGVGAAARDESLLRYWGLFEEEVEIRREDGGRTGYWRVTQPGAGFVLGEVEVPKYAVVYDKRLLGLEGERITIRQALGDKFDYEELMAA